MADNMRKRSNSKMSTTPTHGPGENGSHSSFSHDDSPYKSDDSEDGASFTGFYHVKDPSKLWFEL